MSTQYHDVSYAGLQLTGYDEDGILWTVEALDGWHAAPGVRSSVVSKSGQDGDWPSLPQRSGRLVRIQGKAITTSTVGLEAAARRFAACPVSGEFAVSSEWGALSGQAQLEDAPAFSPGVGWGVWQVTVRLPDPLLYGPPVYLTASLAGVAGTGRVWPRVWPRDWGVPAGQTPGSVTVPNAGTATYWPTLRIDGPVTNPVVTVNETGDWVRINRTVLAGQWLDIDCANRRVLLNGAVSLAADVTYSGRWLGIPVGGASMSYNADSADAAAILTINGFEGAYL